MARCCENAKHFNCHLLLKYLTQVTNHFVLNEGLLQGSRQRPSPQDALHCQGQVLLQDRGGQDQGSWRSLCFDCIRICVDVLLSGQIQFFTEMFFIFS